MKKHIKYLGFCILAGIGLSSCDSDDNGYKPDPVDVGAYAYLANRSITVLDQNETVTLNLFTDGDVQVQSVEIEDGDGNVIATASVSGETATFNTSSLGALETGSFPLTVVSTLSDGTVVRDPAAINVGHAIALDGPSEIQFMDGEEGELVYTVHTFGADVDDLALEYKVGSEATYQADDITAIDLSAALGDGGEIDFGTLDYDAYGLTPGDTLFYQFTATSGSLTDVVETSVIVVPQAFTEGASGTLTNGDDSQLSLVTGETFIAGSEDGDIVFDGTVDQPGFAAATTSDIQFVVTTEEINGVLDARDAFEGALLPTSTVTDVESGDVIVYKVTRSIETSEGVFEDVVHYGYIEVGTVTTVDGTTVSFALSAEEGAVAPEPAI